MITIALYYTGWILSPITILFLLPIIIIIFTFGNFVSGLLASLMTIALYAATSLLLHLGFIPPVAKYFYPLTLISITIQIFFFALTLFIIPILIIPLVNLLGEKEVQAAQLELKYSQINSDLLLRMKELEILNKTMVERELEIVRIKKEAARLTQELGRPKK